MCLCCVANKEFFLRCRYRKNLQKLYVLHNSIWSKVRCFFRSHTTWSCFVVDLPSVLMTLLVGRLEGHPVCKKLDVGLLVVTIDWSFACVITPDVATTCITLSSNKINGDILVPGPVSLCFNGHFPGEPGLAGVYWSKGCWRRWWQLDYWSYKSCKAPVKSSPPTNQHPVFLQAGCPSCRPTNSVKALKGKYHHLG